MQAYAKERDFRKDFRIKGNLKGYIRNLKVNILHNLCIKGICRMESAERRGQQGGTADV